MLRFGIRKPLLATWRRSMATSTSSPGPIEEEIRKKLTSHLNPTQLDITNDSWQHRHHVAMKAEGGGTGETHFSIQIVSESFEGKSAVQRHRMIYSMLSEELSGGLHALSLKTRTTEEAEETLE